MTSHSLNLANDVVRLNQQRKDITSQIIDAQEAVEEELRALAKAAGMKEYIGSHDKHRATIAFGWELV